MISILKFYEYFEHIVHTIFFTLVSVMSDYFLQDSSVGKCFNKTMHHRSDIVYSYTLAGCPSDLHCSHEIKNSVRQLTFTW